MSSIAPVAGYLPVDPTAAVGLQGAQEAVAAMMPDPGVMYEGAAGAGQPAFLSLSPAAQALLDSGGAAAAAVMSDLNRSFAAFDPAQDPANPAYVPPGAGVVPAYDPTQDPGNPAYTGGAAPAPVDWTQDPANPGYWSTPVGASGSV